MFSSNFTRGNSFLILINNNIFSSIQSCCKKILTGIKANCPLFKAGTVAWPSPDRYSSFVAAKVLVAAAIFPSEPASITKGLLVIAAPFSVMLAPFMIEPSDKSYTVIATVALAGPILQAQH